MVMYRTNALWPTRYDYDMAMEDLAENMQDLELRRGQLFRSIKTGFLMQFGLPDTHTCLYRIDNWMIRCFCRVDDKNPNEETIERYQKLSKFFQKHLSTVSALVPLDYIEKGINVAICERDQFHEPTSFLDEGIMPIVKMPYVQGLSLGSFIAAKYEDTLAMNQLSAAWLRMIREMEDAHMAHGDLDLTNVRVQEGPTRRELTLKLIDYDSTWIPDFQLGRYQLAEFGHEHFQHPQFVRSKSATFDETIDRFAALVIYISIQLLVAFPEYYRTWQMSENRLVFAPADYKAEQQGRSERLYELRSLKIKDLEPHIDELSSSLRNNVFMPRSLTSIAEQGSRASFTAQGVSETVTAQPSFNPQLYREVVIPDWDSKVYIDRQQQRPSPSPRPFPEREEQSIQAQAPNLQQQPEDMHTPGNQQEPPQAVQSIQPLPSVYATVEMPVEPERYVPPPMENVRYAAPQQPVRLSSGDEANSPYADTRRADNPASQATPPVDDEKRAQQVQNRQTLKDPATWIGCGIVVIVVLFIVLVILLVVNLGHPHSGGMLPTIYPAMTHAATTRAALAPPLTFRGGSYVE